jgi:uncharacterized membrane protein YsdA (DUF1294 family)
VAVPERERLLVAIVGGHTGAQADGSRVAGAGGYRATDGPDRLKAERQNGRTAERQTTLTFLISSIDGACCSVSCNACQKFWFISN